MKGRISESPASRPATNRTERGSKMAFTYVTLSGIGRKAWEATVSTRWNGFAVPIVSRRVAEDMAHTLSAQECAEMERWEWDGDTLVLTCQECETIRIEPDYAGDYVLDIGYTFEDVGPVLSDPKLLDRWGDEIETLVTDAGVSVSVREIACAAQRR